VDGYIRFFDPDILVFCGTIDVSKFGGHGRLVVLASDITAPIAENSIPGYGIGLFELLAELEREEFKYVRRDELKVLVPTFENPAEPILAAIFGDVPPGARGDVYDSFLKRVDTYRPTVTMDNFLELARGKYLLRRHVCSLGLSIIRQADRGSIWAWTLGRQIGRLSLIDGATPSCSERLRG
jgi:hypothetical protein